MTYWLTIEQAFPVLVQLIFGNDWHLLWGGHSVSWSMFGSTRCLSCNSGKLFLKDVGSVQDHSRGTIERGGTWAYLGSRSLSGFPTVWPLSTLWPSSKELCPLL